LKQFGPGVLFGILAGAAIIYWLHPLNVGAVGVILVVCIAGAVVMGRALGWRGQQRDDKAES